MTPNATSEPPNVDPRTDAQSEPAAEPVTHIEDTTEADVADNAANDAADELIDQAEADPVVPGEPRDAHREDATPDEPPASRGRRL